MVKRVGIHEKGEISLCDIMQTIRKNPRMKEAGAITCFIGIVRGRSKGKKVKKLYFEAYKEQAEKSLAKISSDLRKKPGIVDVFIHHMTGTLKVGENILFVVVAGKSRGNVFPVLAEVVERIKREAPIWKKEYTEKNAHWVSEKRNL